MKTINNELPPALPPGSTIGIVAPAGNIQNVARFEKGVKILHEMGYKTKFPRNLWPGSDYLADKDEKRIDEFNHMWADSEVDAIISARGGYGSLRIAGKLECHCQDDKTKLFIGFSDVTLIHQQINRLHNLATLHGPVVTSLSNLDSQSLQLFSNVLRRGISQWKCDSQLELLQGTGTIKGVGGGGNLSTIVSSIGTSISPDFKGKIVFLEDTAEAAYKVDRMLTQLMMSGLLDGVKGLVLGDFSNGLNLDRNQRISHHESIWSRCLELTDKSIAILANFPMGHGDVNHPLPLGTELTIDCSKGKIEKSR